MKKFRRATTSFKTGRQIQQKLLQDSTLPLPHCYQWPRTGSKISDEERQWGRWQVHKKNDPDRYKAHSTLKHSMWDGKNSKIMKEVSHSPSTVLRQCAWCLFYPPPHPWVRRSSSLSRKKNEHIKSKDMIILRLKMPTDNMPKITATSAREALEWDSRKHNVGHWTASQRCLRMVAGPLPRSGQTEPTDRRPEGELSGAAGRCPTLRTENIHRDQSPMEAGQFRYLPRVHPQGIFFHQKRRLTWVVQDTFSRII